MVFLLVIATLLAPVAAIVFAEWWTERRRAKAQPPAPYTEAYEDEGVKRAKAKKAEGRFPKPGWVAEAIRDHKEGKTDG